MTEMSSSEPITISDFAWRQLPPNSKIPNYFCLGTNGVDCNGRNQIIVTEAERREWLLSGAVWSEYAKKGFTVDQLHADSLRTVYNYKARLDRHRPLSDDTVADIFEKYCNAYNIERKNNITCGSADPELKMLVQGGVIAGGCHQLMRAEKKDLASALSFIANTIETTSCTQILRSPQTFLACIKSIHARLSF